MNRRLIITQIVIWSLIGIALLGVLVSGVLKQGFSFVTHISMGGNMKQVYEKTVSLTGVNDLTLELTSMDVTFAASENGELRVVQYAAGNLQESDYVTVEQSGDKVAVRQPVWQGFWLFHMPVPQRLTVYLPASYSQSLTLRSTSGNVDIEPALNLQKLDLKLTSGNVYSEDTITAKDLRIRMTSGDVGVYALVCDTYDIASTSGNIRGGELTGKGSIQLTSGEIIFESITGESHRLESTSGNIRIGALTGEADMQAASGNVTAKFMAPLSNITAHAGSGNINLTLPAGAGATVKATCGSGNINGDIGFSYDKNGKNATATVNGGGAVINASVGSGNITISQK